jgi:hypothetical protein
MLGNQVCTKIQMSSVNNNAVFQDDNAPIHSTGIVLSWFEEHESNFYHLPRQFYRHIQTSLIYSDQFRRQT